VTIGLCACAGAAASAVSAPPTASLRAFVCTPSLDVRQRLVSVDAVMRPIAGTAKLTMRFELLMKPKGSREASEVGGGDLGSWISPTPPTLGERPGDVWIVHHPVGSLTVPAVYWFRVSFRWIGADGTVLSTVVRTGPKCDQPDLRPDLEVASIAVQPNVNRSGLESYMALIRNIGRSVATGPFEVVFAPGGGQRQTIRTINRLGPHQSRFVNFTGPPCSSLPAPPRITVDPTGVVNDLNRANNTLTAMCGP
jgi:hypothetical protein